MRKYLTGVAAVAISMSLAGCQEKAEAPANEAVVEEPVANDVVDANASMDMNATDETAADANATDAAAADANATEQGSTDH